MEKDKSLIAKKIESLLKLLDITAEIAVEETDKAYTVSIDAKEDNALLIGKHGNTLSSLEYIIYILVAKKLKQEKRILVEIGGYRADRENYLGYLAQKLKEDVIATGSEKTVRGLKPWERRHIHLMLAEDQEVTTESIGEGRDRILIIKKK